MFCLRFVFDHSMRYQVDYVKYSFDFYMITAIDFIYDQNM